MAILAEQKSGKSIFELLGQMKDGQMSMPRIEDIVIATWACLGDKNKTLDEVSALIDDFLEEEDGGFVRLISLLGEAMGFMKMAGKTPAPVLKK
jgi:hypothetical protein